MSQQSNTANAAVAMQTSKVAITITARNNGRWQVFAKTSGAVFGVRSFGDRTDAEMYACAIAEKLNR